MFAMMPYTDKLKHIKRQRHQGLKRLAIRLWERESALHIV